MENYHLVLVETINFKKGWDRVSKGKRYGIKDAYGNLICPIIYSFISDFTDGLAVIKFKKNIFAKELWGVIDEKLKVNLFSEEYKDVQVLNRKILTVQLPDGGWRLIKKSGEKIPGPTYENCPGPFHDELAPVLCNGLLAFINEDGHQICKAIRVRCYDYNDDGTISLYRYGNGYNGYVVYRMNKKGVIWKESKR